MYLTVFSQFGVTESTHDMQASSCTIYCPFESWSKAKKIADPERNNRRFSWSALPAVYSIRMSGKRQEVEGVVRYQVATLLLLLLLLLLLMVLALL